jgi:hypothetical protein
MKSEPRFDMSAGFIPDSPELRAPAQRLIRLETLIVVALGVTVCAIGTALGMLAAFAWEQWR